MNVGQKIRASREARRMSVREFSAHLLCTPSYLSKVERGLEQPGEDFLEAVGGRLGWTRPEIDKAILSTGRVPRRIVRKLQQMPKLIQVLEKEDNDAAISG